MLALELFEEAKVPQFEIYGFDCYRGSKNRCHVHVSPEALIQIYHHFGVPRKFVTAKVAEEYVHIHVPVRGCIFTGLVRLQDAGKFLDSSQRQLRAPKSRPKHIGNDQRRLAFAGGSEQ